MVGAVCDEKVQKFMCVGRHFPRRREQASHEFAVLRQAGLARHEDVVVFVSAVEPCCEAAHLFSFTRAVDAFDDYKLAVRLLQLTFFDERFERLRHGINLQRKCKKAISGFYWRVWESERTKGTLGALGSSNIFICLCNIRNRTRVNEKVLSDIMSEAMEVPPPIRQMGYDRAIAVFSPEGRMYQVEYARKAAEKATTALGMVFAGGIILVASKMLQRLLVPESVEKLSKVDEHIGVASCGILADARTLIDFARVRAQVNKITFSEPIETYALVKDIADRVQRFTQLGGIRPYGVGLLIGGVNGTARLFETDPSGTIREWKAHAIGRGAKDARKVLIEEYKEGLTKDKAIDLAIRALKAGEKKISTRSVDIAVIEKKIRVYSASEKKELLKKYV